MLNGPLTLLGGRSPKWADHETSIWSLVDRPQPMCLVGALERARIGTSSWLSVVSAAWEAQLLSGDPATNSHAGACGTPYPLGLL
jgi:hypothetical protein